MCERSIWFCFASSTSLYVHGELNHIIVASRHMFTPLDHLTWVNVEGGCYIYASHVCMHIDHFHRVY